MKSDPGYLTATRSRLCIKRRWRLVMNCKKTEGGQNHGQARAPRNQGGQTKQQRALLEFPLATSSFRAMLMDLALHSRDFESLLPEEWYEIALQHVRRPLYFSFRDSGRKLDILRTVTVERSPQRRQW